MTARENFWLRVAKVSKHLGAVIALEAFDGNIRLGEVLALVGDNGAGKSTLVKLLSGAYLPSSGEVMIEGNPVTIENPGKARHAAVSFACFLPGHDRGLGSENDSIFFHGWTISVRAPISCRRMRTLFAIASPSFR